MDSTLKSCKLVKVIQVVTKEGTGTKENPIRESIAYFTTDGARIGTLVKRKEEKYLDGSSIQALESTEVE